ncbi:MAG: maleylpyruvate isomerase family mycothiol-dependent enzyme [Actinomycetia bacterium]|nr:maleylpyruvate isomerase family mycothiol-dependent enzyme [Actinomycetes bacterium]
MVVERDLEPGDLYEHERVGFLSSLRLLPAQRLTVEVAATPGWTVHDVLAHVVGITADLNAQRFGDGEDFDAWTEEQVLSRRDASLEELEKEWDREAPVFESGLKLFGYQFGAHYLGDLLHHVADVRVALGQVADRDDDGIAVALDFYLESFVQTLAEAGVGAVGVDVGDERWVLGQGDVIASIRSSRYEFFRALGGRRTLSEIAGMDWSGDADVVLGLVSRYPVPLASLDEIANH